MLHLVVALFITFLGTALGQIAYGVPVQNGLFIPVNVTNSRNVLPYPNKPIENNYPSFRSTPNLYPPAYGTNNHQYNYPSQSVNQAQYPSLQPTFKNQTNFTSASNQVVYGNREVGDKNLFRTHVVKGVSIFRSAVTKTIVYPDPQSKLRVQKITQIVVKNNKNSSKRWSPEIMSGGVGKQMVEMKLKCRDDMDLALDIYGFAIN